MDILIGMAVDNFRSKLNDLLTREPPITIADLRSLQYELECLRDEFQDVIHFVEELSDQV